jgi:bacteriocin biosynthesis cyclodehydratase domain-containing protein
MSCFKMQTGIAVIGNSHSGWFIVDERGRKKITSGLVAKLVGLIRQGPCDEEGLVAALEDHVAPNRIHYALIQLEKQGIIARDAVQQESPADLFRAKARVREEVGYPLSPVSVMVVRILAIGGADASADGVADSLSRSEVLRIERVQDWHGQEMATDAVYVVVTPDYLEPELEGFGRFAHENGLRWLPLKVSGVIPWMGPLFVPGETGCVMCLLDRVRGHRRPEAQQICQNGGKESLRLSAGQTIHSLETASGLLAVELEKLAAGDTPEMTRGVFTLDFRTLRLTRHPLVKRSQCPVCGALFRENTRSGTMPNEPLHLQSRLKADYRDGGERVCPALQTLEKYAHLISPVTGVVGRLTKLEDVPPCFGQVVKSDWIVRGSGETKRNVHNGRFSATGLSTGKGRSELQARASALGEAVERYCSQHEGYEPHIRASFVELGDVAMHPYDLMGFSERQYRNREVWRQAGGTASVPDPYDAARPIDWTPAWSMTQQRWRLIPSAFAYYSYPQEGGGDICSGCSNGVAAGNCLEEAIMQGFFELIERDATAMWWYHRLSKPAVDWHSFSLPFVAAVNDAMDSMGMRLEILDLTNDMGIPVFAANLFDSRQEGRFRSIGLGCHRDPHIALERAVSELGQAWRLADRDEYSLKFRNSPQSRELFLRADPYKTPKTSSDFALEQRDDFLDDIEDAVLLLRARGLEMLAMDLTRPDVGFPVARVIVPGFAHFWPRFGCRRLFEVPKAAGWIGGDTGEDDLNPVPFFL